VVVGTAKVRSIPTIGSPRLSRLHDSSPSTKLNSSRTLKGGELTCHRQEDPRKSRTVYAGASNRLLRILTCLQVCCRSWDVDRSCVLKRGGDGEEHFLRTGWNGFLSYRISIPPHVNVLEVRRALSFHECSDRPTWHCGAGTHLPSIVRGEG